MRHACMILFISLLLFSGLGSAKNFSIHKIGDWGSAAYTDIFSKGNYIYCTAGKGGLDIIDVRDALNPRKISNYDTPGKAMGVYVHGNLAFVADGEAGLQIIDISNPFHPLPVGNYVSREIYALTVVEKDGYVYLGSMDYSWDEDFFYQENKGGVWGIDVSDPSKPVKTFFQKVAIDMKRMQIRGNLLYIVATLEAAVMDLSNPAVPVKVTGLDIQDIYIHDLYWRGSRLYILSSEYLNSYDLENPRKPKLLNSSKNENRAARIYSKFDHLYLTDSRRGLVVLDAGAVGSPLQAWVDRDNVFPGASAICGRGNYIYMTGADSGMFTANIGNSAEPILTGTVNHYSSGLNMILDGDNIYMVDEKKGIRIMDISHSATPEPLVKAETDNWGHWGDSAPVIKDIHYLYVAGDIKGLKVYDISDPASMKLAYPFGSLIPTDICIRNNTLYAAGHNGLNIFDVSNPPDFFKWGAGSGSQTIGHYPGMTLITAIRAKGDFLYMVGNNYDFQVLDINQPANPVLKGIESFKKGTRDHQVQDLFISGDYAYVTLTKWQKSIRGNMSILNIIDINRPSAPKLVGACDFPGNGRQIKVDGSYAFIASGEAGLQVINIRRPHSPVLKESVPTSGSAVAVEIKGNYVWVLDRQNGKLLVYKHGNPRKTPRIKLDRNRLNFRLTTGTIGEDSLAVHISNSGGGTLDYRIKVDRNWISISDRIGTGESRIKISTDARELAPGNYYGTVTISADNAINDFQKVYVALTVIK